MKTGEIRRALWILQLSAIVICISPAQEQPRSLKDIVDTSAVVAVGRVVSDVSLSVVSIDSSRAGQGLHGIGSTVDGTVYQVAIENVLKGTLDAPTIDILSQSGPDSLNTSGFPYLMYRSKRYIFCLSRTHVDSSLRVKHNLGTRQFFSPTSGGLGVMNLKDQMSIELLNQITTYLAIPSVAVQLTDITSWIDSLITSVGTAVTNGWLSNGSFANELSSQLNSAKNYLTLGDSVRCGVELLVFKNEILSTYGRMASGRLIGDQWFETATSDVAYLLACLSTIAEPFSPPFINRIEPSGVGSGGQSFTLSVRGEDFIQESVVQWNWLPRATSFVSKTELQAAISAADLVVPDTASVAVANPDGCISNAVSFFVTRPLPGIIVKLINSTGTKLTGGSLQYYDGTWKDATNNNGGTFNITTSLKTLSLRMTYEFATQTKSNVTVGYDTVAFQTVNAQIKLQSSQGAPIDTGTVQYYFSSWKTLGTTTNGVASKELLPGTYTFRMTYASATLDKQQDIGANPVVIFQTVNASVQLKNSQGALMPVPLGDQGTVQYYFSSWKNFGATTGGVATKELLPGNYTFRMTHESISNDKVQNISTNNTVSFSTVLCTVRVVNSQNQPVNGALASYYFSAWRQIGLTADGEITKELLPANLTFRITVGTVSEDKAQNTATNGLVEFVTQ